MSPETEEHRRIKEIILEKLKEDYGTGLTEYPHLGNVNDIYVVTSDRTVIFVENVWTSKRANFYRDLTILQRTDANVKILIVNPDILGDGKLVREYEKTRIVERKRGNAISEMIDGSKILHDSEFVNNVFSKIVKELISEAQKPKSPVKKTPAEIFDDKNWGIIKTPEQFRCISILSYPNVPYNVNIELNKKNKEELRKVPSNVFVSMNYFPTPKSYVIESGGRIGSLPYRKIEIFQTGLIKLNRIKEVHKSLIFAGEIGYWLGKFLEYTPRIYSSISKPSVDRFYVGLAIDKASGKQLSFGGDEHFFLEDWQICTEDLIKISAEVILPVHTEEVIEIFKKNLKPWFKMD